jgi:hypothetical protein
VLSYKARSYFWSAQSRNTNVSAFVTVFKATVWQKTVMGDLAYLMAVK